MRTHTHTHTQTWRALLTQHSNLFAWTIMCNGPFALAWSEASPSDPQSCPVMGHWMGLWPLGFPATLPQWLLLTPLLFSLCADAFGLKLEVKGLGTRGHTSVTQARNTLNLGVVTYYHPFLSSGLGKHWDFLPSGRDRSLVWMLPVQKLNGVLSTLNWYISLLIPPLPETRICASKWKKSTDFQLK